MRDLLRVWRRVETLPVPAGVLAAWRAWLGDDLPVLERCLRPEQGLATAYPCPHPVHDGCPRRVVHHGPDRIVAVCGNTSACCEPLVLERRDLVIHALDPSRWLAEVTAALRAANGLSEATLAAPAGVVTVGTLARRGKRLAVVWIRDPDRDVETLASALRSRLDGDGLVVLRPPGTGGATDQLLPDGIVLLSPPERDDGDLDLWRALDLIDPGYRRTRIDEPLAIFDEVTLELATVPGERHVVRIDGHELGGFQRSDVKFMRLLLLAAARKADPDGGWVRKTKLQDDDKNHETEAVRFELEKGHHPRLTAVELRALVKTSPKRDGTVRLAVRPERIRLDPSLARLELVGEQQTQPTGGKRRQTSGARQLAQNLEQGRAVSEALLAAARQLGAPGPAADRG
jgi:hypothetical protein